MSTIVKISDLARDIELSLILDRIKWTPTGINSTSLEDKRKERNHKTIMI